MLFCKAQVVGWQISKFPTLSTTSLNGSGIWIQHMDGQIKTIFGTEAFLRIRGLQKVQKFIKIVFQKKLDGLENCYISYFMGSCSEI